MKKLQSLALAGAMTAALAAPALADDKMTDITVAVGAPTLTFAPVFVGKEAGIFAKHGINVTVRTVDGAATVNAILSGSVEFALPAGNTLLRAAAKGQRVLIISTIVDKPMFELVARKDFMAAHNLTEKSSLADKGKALKGQTVAMQGVGSVIDTLVRVVARKGGLDPDKDMNITPMDPPAMYPALKNKQVVAYATSLPFTTQAVLGGDADELVSGPLGDVPDYLPYAYVVVATRAAYCQKSPDICRAVAESFQESTQLIRQHPDQALPYLKKTFPQMDTHLLEEAWKVASQATAADIHVSDKALLNARQFDIDSGISKEGDEIKDLAGFYTNEYLK